MTMVEICNAMNATMCELYNGKHLILKCVEKSGECFRMIVRENGKYSKDNLINQVFKSYEDCKEYISSKSYAVS